MGLLSRANTLDKIEKNPGLTFFDFVKKHSIKKCTLLEKNASNYIVKNSIGFDAQSILSATSTVDFWEGICKDSGKLYTYSNENKGPLLQLFSFNLKDIVQEVYVYKNSSLHILLSLEKPSEQALKDFENINEIEHKINVLKLNPLLKEGSVVLLFTIDISKASEAFYNAKSKASNLDYAFFLKALMNELYNRFICCYNGSDSTIKENDFCLKTVFITDKAYSSELIINHIKLNLKEVLEDYTDSLKIQFAGSADSCEEIESFFQAD